MAKNTLKSSTIVGENFEIYLSQMAKNALILSTMVGEKFEIYNLQMTRNAFLSAKICPWPSKKISKIPDISLICPWPLQIPDLSLTSQTSQTSLTNGHPALVKLRSWHTSQYIILTHLFTVISQIASKNRGAHHPKNLKILEISQCLKIKISIRRSP